MSVGLGRIIPRQSLVGVTKLTTLPLSPTRTVNSDIFCLIETQLNVDPSLQLEGYTWINFSRSVKHARAPKPSDGVGLFIKQSLLQEYNGFTLDKTVDGILILQFKHN